MRRRTTIVITALSAWVLVACGGSAGTTAGSPAARSRSAATSTASPTASPASMNSSPGAATRAQPTGVTSRLPPDSVVTASLKALRRATSFRASGTAHESDGNVAFDMHYSGRDSEGSVALKGHAMQLRYASGQAYERASHAAWLSFLAGSASASRVRELATALADKWVHLAGKGSDFGGLGKIADRTAFLAGLDGLMPPAEHYGRAPVSTLRGQQVVVLSSGQGESVYVPADAIGPPVRVEVTLLESATIDFRDVGKPFRVAVPPADEIVQLGG